MHDLAMSATWDLVPNGTGGLSTVDGIACDYQDISYRAQTNNPDHALWPLGADLEDLIGLPNTQATGSKGEASLKRALTFDGRFAASTTSVVSTPLNANQIEFSVGIANSEVKTSAAFYVTVVQLES